MSTQTLHPALAVGDMIDLLRDGVREVNGISNLDDIRLIQACAEAAELDVMWKLTRNGQQAVLVEIPSPATAQSIVSDFIAQVKATGLRAAIYVEGDGGTITAQPHDLDVRVLTPEQLRARDQERAESSAVAVERLAYSPDEAAAALGVTRQTIYALIGRKQLRRFKVGRLTRIPATDVQALVGAKGGDHAAA